MSNKERGKVKFFNQEKGFGFIEQDGKSKDVFVHKNNTNFDIKEGDRVKFLRSKGQKGEVAIDVEKD